MDDQFTLPVFKQSFYFFRLEAVEANIVEGSGNAADHFVEETAAMDEDLDAWSFFADFNAVDLFYRIVTGAASGCGKCSKIMFPDQMLCRLLHLFHFQSSPANGPAIAGFKWIGLAFKEFVNVEFSFGTV